MKPRRESFSSVLFWAMLLAGGFPLAACLVLPAWFEYDAARRQHEEAELRVARLEQRRNAVDRQIEHLQDNEEYLARLLRRESGLEDGGQTIAVVDPNLHLESLEPSPASVEDTPLAELSAFVDQTVRRYPVAAIFVVNHTRPLVMAVSGAMVVSALLLLCRWTPAPRAT